MHSHRVVAVLGLAVFLAACSAEKKCTPNEQTACACPGGGVGAQTCSAEGTGYAACDCSAPPASCTADNAPQCVHGSCAVDNGFAGCQCEAGYTGVLCESCAVGYQDNDGDGICAKACAGGGVDCGAHGTCSDQSGAAVCTCDEGYAGASCDTCAETHQDHDHDGQCAPTCESAQLGCSGHGSCDDQSGAPSCVCAQGYTGDDCGTCADGYQDNDHDGTCETTCATVSCGEHSVCSDSSGTAACGCVAGYAVDGGTCSFAGIVQDPSFENMPQAWVTTGDAGVDPTAQGNGNAGYGILDAAAVCAKDSISQSVEIPAFAQSEPLSLSFDLGKLCPGACSTSAPATLTLDGRVVGSTGGTGWSHQRVCLGEPFFGGVRALSFQSSASSCDPAVPTPVIDNVTISPDPSCPAPGTVLNGDLEGTGGWSGSGVWSIGAGLGADGTSGARIATTNYCQGASLTGTMSVPSSLSHPALELKFNELLGGVTTVSFGNDAFTQLVGAGGPSFTTARLCVPAALEGKVVNLGFSLPFAGGYCSQPNARQFLVDDLQFVDDPGCGDGSVLNGNFERTEVGSSWLLPPSGYGAGGLAEITTAGARSGARALHIAFGSACDQLSAVTLITVPPATGTAGPALRYWYKRAGSNQANFTSSVGGSLPFATTWTLRTECLNPAKQGTVLPLVSAGRGREVIAPTRSTTSCGWTTSR